MGVVAALIVVGGVIELARGDSDGTILTASGVVVGVLAYWRYRKG